MRGAVWPKCMRQLSEVNPASQKREILLPKINNKILWKKNSKEIDVKAEELKENPISKYLNDHATYIKEV